MPASAKKGTRSVPSRQSFDKQAAAWLRDAIIEGRYAPGERLTEIALSEEIELSRSTTRTALLHLAAEGLVVQEAYSGWRVAALSARDAHDVCALRSVLDGLAARTAAEQITTKGSDSLEAHLEQLVRQARNRSSARHLADADMAFHSHIVDLSGNRRLREQYDRLRGIVLLYVRATNLRSTSDVIVGEHTAIFDAIAAGDPRRAERLAIRHVMDHGAQLEAELATGKQ